MTANKAKQAEQKAKEFETELLKRLPMNLAFEHQDVKNIMSERIKNGLDPADDKDLMRRYFALQMNPEYIHASEEAAEKVYAQHFEEFAITDPAHDRKPEPDMH